MTEKSEQIREMKERKRAIDAVVKIANELQGIHQSLDVLNAILVRDHLVGDSAMDKRAMERLQEIIAQVNRSKFGQ